VVQGECYSIAGGSEMLDSHFRNQLLIAKKTENSFTTRPTYTTPGHISKWCSNIPQRHLLSYVHSTFIHNSQTMETT
jgi:hypothetical protein